MPNQIGHNLNDIRKWVRDTTLLYMTDNNSTERVSSIDEQWQNVKGIKTTNTKRNSTRNKKTVKMKWMIEESLCLMA